MAFGDNLKFIRKERDITQEQLADILSVSRQAISKWESNNGYPETEKLIMISQQLNVSIDYLFNDQSNVENNENKSVVYVSSGKIAITTFDKKNIVHCQAVKSTQVIAHGKGPKYILFGVEGINFWGEKTQILGWYETIEKIQDEIEKINQAILQGNASYELQYFTKIKYKGIFGQPHIVE